MNQPAHFRTARFVAALGVGLVAPSCGSTTEASTTETTTSAATEASTSAATEASGGETTPGISLVTVDEAAAIIDSAPANLVVLDVRTQEEFDDAHLADAILVDFYADDFADQLAELDTDVPYVLYCQSGNRSGQAAAIMDSLGFREVYDVDGGITAWLDAGLPTA